MKRLFAALAAGLLAAGSAMANYPDHDDYLWVTVPDHADWLYETGDSARIEISVYRYGQPLASETLSYTIGPDMLDDDTSGTLTLDAQGRAVLNMGTMQVPGFRDLRLATIAAPGSKAVSSHHVKVGFSPEKLKAFTGEPADFDAFWAKALEDDSKTPLSYTIEPSPKYTTPKMNAYLVKLNLPGPKVTAMYGYLFIPKGEPGQKFPATFCPPGAGVKTIKDPLNHRYYGEGGMIRLEAEIHGVHPELPEDSIAAIRKVKGDYLSDGWDSPDTYYMRDVYLGCRRWLDFLSQLPEFDGENLFVQGGSQGGALAITTSALDPRVKGCAANHPALSDMNGYLGDKTGGYPHHFRKNPTDGTPERVKTLEYYDVVNFAKRLRCPVRMTWGYNDNTCPPTTSYEVYNVITAPKHALLTPINEHWTSRATEQGHYHWLKSLVK